MNGRLMASPTTPLPLTRSSSCPRWSERTVLSLPTSAGRTMPRTVMVWRSELTSTSLVASTSMAPLGSTLETRAVSVVVITTPRLVEPWPLSCVLPVTPARLAHAAHRDGLALRVDIDVLGGFHQHGAIGQHGRHARRERGGDHHAAAGRALAVELRVAGDAGQVSPRARRFGNAGEGGYRVRGAGAAPRFGGARDHRGSVLHHQNGDQVVDLAGSQVARRVGQTRTRHPDPAGSGGRSIRRAGAGVGHEAIER